MTPISGASGVVNTLVVVSDVPDLRTTSVKVPPMSVATLIGELLVISSGLEVSSDQCTDLLVDWKLAPVSIERIYLLNQRIEAADCRTPRCLNASLVRQNFQGRLCCAGGILCEKRFAEWNLVVERPHADLFAYVAAIDSMRMYDAQSLGGVQ